MTTRTDQQARTTWQWRGPALAAYAIALGVWIVLIGVPTDPYQMFGWLWLATIVWNIQAPARSHLAFVRDWWLIFVGLILYLYSRGMWSKWPCVTRTACGVRLASETT